MNIEDSDKIILLRQLNDSMEFLNHMVKKFQEDENIKSERNSLANSIANLRYSK